MTAVAFVSPFVETTIEPSPLGNFTHFSEYRVHGLGEYGHWDHGWRRQGRDAALAHAADMAPDSFQVFVERRVVECEVIEVIDVSVTPEIAPIHQPEETR